MATELGLSETVRYGSGQARCGHIGQALFGRVHSEESAPMHDRESPTFPTSAIATHGQHSSRYHLCYPSTVQRPFQSQTFPETVLFLPSSEFDRSSTRSARSVLELSLAAASCSSRRTPPRFLSPPSLSLYATHPPWAASSRPHSALYVRCCG